jgi:hypothetical protein
MQSKWVRALDAADQQQSKAEIKSMKWTVTRTLRKARIQSNCIPNQFAVSLRIRRDVSANSDREIKDETQHLVIATEALRLDDEHKKLIIKLI